MLKRHEIDMTTGSLWKKIIQFSIPVFFTNLLQILYNAADMMIVGNFSENGDGGLAAIGATSSLFHLITNLFIGIGIGVSAIAARHVGAGEKNDVRKTIETSFAVSLICGVIVAVAGYFVTPTLLVMMKTDPEVLHDATVYLRIILAGAPVLLLYNFGSAVFRAIGDTERPLIFLTVSGVVNIVLNLFFVLACKMGVSGVAIATVISQGLSAFLVWRCLATDDEYYRFDPKRTRIHLKELKSILLVGLPSGIQSCMFSFSNVIMQSTVNSFGKAVMAASAASGNVEALIDTANSSICSATLTFTSQNVGAKNLKRVKGTLKVSVLLIFVFSICASIPVVIFRHELISLFNNNPDVIKNGGVRLSINASTYVIAGMMTCFANFLRGLGVSVIPMFISIFCIVIYRMIFIYFIYPLLPQTFGSMLLVYPSSWLMNAFLMFCAILLCFKAFKKKNGLLN
ncbi:MAG: MATE family efflux transporter [Ruminococcaceae bacterium]|nr:MATE family efflux transporter [Oscillospiraceae bacterium]